MKLFPIILLSLIGAGAFAQQKTANRFVVNGKLAGAVKLKLYLSEAKKLSATMYQDSATTDAAGNFSFTGSFPEPRLAMMTIAGSRRLMDRVTFFIEPNTTLEIKGSADSLALAGITGSEENVLTKAFAADFNKKLAVFSAENMKLYLAAKAKNDSAAMQREGKIADRKNIDSVSGLITAFVTEHPASAASVEFIETLFKYARVATADSLLRMVEKTPAGKYASAQQLRETLNIQRSLMKGAIAPDFAQPDTTGHSVSLLSLRGKYVLVDFWASWCGPCRAENPNVLKAYNKYKGKNFTVFAVSLDNNRKAWIRAIKDDQLPWAQVSDLKGFENTAAKQYGVKAIPTNFLIDPRGKIIASNLRGDDLEKALEASIN